MKQKSYNSIVTIFALCFLGTIFGQKFDKKFTENFKVNKDVEVAINASNTKINVITWNKNEVEVTAFIEIEGLSKEEAEKYFKNWNFEALGNKNKVKIMAKGNNSLGLEHNFTIFNNMDFTFPKIEMPNFDSIVIPDMNFDFNFDFAFAFDSINILDNLDDFDKNLSKTGEYSFDWNDGVNKITIKSKKEWEAFKNSKKYKLLKLKMRQEKLKMERSFAKSKIEMKKGLAKAKLEYKKIDKEKIKKELQAAKEQILKMKLNFNSNIDSIRIDGKKIKVNKRLEIKVPKSATFDLNTRHCAVKFPNTVASGKISYGTFDASNLTGGKLTIDYAPVNINALDACTLFLNNVTDAKIASVTNSKISNNSSGVSILTIKENVAINSKFGELTIEKIIPNYQSFNMFLDYTDTTIHLSNIPKSFVYDVGDKSPEFQNKLAIKLNVLDLKSKDINGNFIVKTKDDSFLIQGKYSQLTLKK